MTAKIILIFIINQMEIKKFKRGDRLQVTLMELAVGECVRVPYRYFSENSIRATASQLKSNKAVEYDINTQSNVAAIITRMQ